MEETKIAGRIKRRIVERKERRKIRMGKIEMRKIVEKIKRRIKILNRLPLPLPLLLLLLVLLSLLW